MTRPTASFRKASGMLSWCINNSILVLMYNLALEDKSYHEILTTCSSNCRPKRQYCTLRGDSSTRSNARVMCFSAEEVSAFKDSNQVTASLAELTLDGLHAWSMAAFN